MNINKFPKGIEVITGVIIRNSKNQILLAKSPKWANKWTIPGGHIEPGEKIVQCAIREATEETGLNVNYECVLSFSEMIIPKNYYRQAHFIGFNCLVSTSGEQVKLDNKELAEYIWIDVEDALALKDVSESIIKPLHDYQAYLTKILFSE